MPNDSQRLELKSYLAAYFTAMLRHFFTVVMYIVLLKEALIVIFVFILFVLLPCNVRVNS